MTTVYLIGAIVALCSVIGVMWKINRMRVKGFKLDIADNEERLRTLRDIVVSQEDEIRKRDQMIDTLQEIEIDHIKKSKKLRTPDNRANVRNASDIMRDLAGAGDSDGDSSSS
ncbi:hypothetical protein [Oceanispirochaeta sp.]|uniref:hypothetical protein n=1 Tax=Oceanispirochaeta sp. TaxID=2035350 RepID=UPI00261A9C06|nr:hypothetical protein [Oceanispirochaeta sp.]MDA3956877.1 hypothetical protein [Oceanispirochaeta sp.]